jgi:Glycosyl transferase family 2
VQYNFCSRAEIKRLRASDERIAVISLRHPEKPPLRFAGLRSDRDGSMLLDIACNDITESMPGRIRPTPEIAGNIQEFWRAVKGRVTRFVCQCENGVGLCQGVVAALVELDGIDPKPILRRGTYNRLLYRLILETAGKQPVPEPLVSIVCRISYPFDRFQAFMLCMERQRYTNWQVVAVTDGPRDDVARYVQSREDAKVHLIQTAERVGHWGHPYRQQGIDAAQGEIIGLQNDDNYLVPGFLEQLVWAIQDGADLVLCDTVHSYLAWASYRVEARRSSCDLGAFLVRAGLIRQVKWPGNDQESDGEFIEGLAALAGRNKIACIRRPLFIHN